MGRLGVAAVLALSLVCGGAGLRAADAELEARPAEVDIQMPEWKSAAYFPIHVHVQARKPERLTFNLDGNGTNLRRFGIGRRVNYNLRRTLVLPAGSSANLELLGMGSATLRVTDVQGNVIDPSPFAIHSRDFRLHNQQSLVLINSYRRDEALAAQKAAVEKAGGARWPPTTIETTSLLSAHLPRRWQAYAGLSTPLLFAADDLRRLDGERAEALARGVQFLGLRLFVAGPDAALALKDSLGFDADARAEDREEPFADAPEPRIFKWLTGRVVLMDEYNPVDWAEALARLTRIGQSRLAEYDGSTPSNLEWMFERVPGLSTFSVVALLALLGLVLGPLNYWLVRRKGRLLTFFVTTPLLAVAGAALIFFLSVAAEGVSTKYAEAAVLLQRAGTDQAVMIHHRVVHGGLFTPRLVYPEQTLLLPFREGNDTINVTIDDGNQQRLSGDWVAPRTPSGIIALYPVTLRLGVEVVEEDGAVHVVNQSRPIARLALRRPDGRVWRTDAPLASGERRRLQAAPAGHDAVLSALIEAARREAGDQLKGLDAARVTLAAECEGLDYLEDGRLDGVLTEGRYYLLAAE